MAAAHCSMIYGVCDEGNPAWRHKLRRFLNAPAIARNAGVSFGAAAADALRI